METQPTDDMPSLEQARRAGRSALLTEAHRALRVIGADPKLSKRQTATARGVSVATLDRMIRRGDFPPGEWVSPGRRGWPLSVVQAVPPVTVASPRGGLRPRRRGKTLAAEVTELQGMVSGLERTVSARRGGKLQRRADRGRA